MQALHRPRAKLFNERPRVRQAGAASIHQPWPASASFSNARVWKIGSCMPKGYRPFQGNVNELKCRPRVQSDLTISKCRSTHSTSSIATVSHPISNHPTKRVKTNTKQPSALTPKSGPQHPGYHNPVAPPSATAPPGPRPVAPPPSKPKTTPNSSSAPSSLYVEWCANSAAKTTNSSATGRESTKCIISRRRRS